MLFEESKNLWEHSHAQIMTPKEIQMLIIILLMNIHRFRHHFHEQLNVWKIIFASIKYCKWGAQSVVYRYEQLRQLP